MEVDRKLREELRLDSQKLREEFWKLRYGESQAHNSFIPKRFEDLKLNGGVRLGRIPIKLNYHRSRFKKSKSARRTRDLKDSLDRTGLAIAQRCVRVKTVRMKKQSNCEKKAAQIKLAQACKSLGLFLDSSRIQNRKDYMQICLGNRQIFDTRVKPETHLFWYGFTFPDPMDIAGRVHTWIGDQRIFAEEVEALEHDDPDAAMESLQDVTSMKSVSEEINKLKNRVKLSHVHQMWGKRGFHKVRLKVILHQRSKVAAEKVTKGGELFKLGKPESLHRRRSKYTRRPITVRWYYYKVRKRKDQKVGFNNQIEHELQDSSHEYPTRTQGNYPECFQFPEMPQSLKNCRKIYLQAKRNGKSYRRLQLELSRVGGKIKGKLPEDVSGTREEALEYKVFVSDNGGFNLEMLDENMTENYSFSMCVKKKQTLKLVKLSLEEATEKQRTWRVCFRKYSCMNITSFYFDTGWRETSNIKDYFMRFKRGYKRSQLRKSHVELIAPRGSKGGVKFSSVGVDPAFGFWSLEDKAVILPGSTLKLYGEKTAKLFLSAHDIDSNIQWHATCGDVSQVPRVVYISEKQTSSWIHGAVTDGNWDPGGRSCEKIFVVFVKLAMQMEHNHKKFLLQLNSQVAGLKQNQSFTMKIVKHISSGQLTACISRTSWMFKGGSIDKSTMPPELLMGFFEQCGCSRNIRRDVGVFLLFEEFHSPRPPEHMVSSRMLYADMMKGRCILFTSSYGNELILVVGSTANCKSSGTCVSSNEMVKKETVDGFNKKIEILVSVTIVIYEKMIALIKFIILGSREKKFFVFDWFQSPRPPEQNGEKSELVMMASDFHQLEDKLVLHRGSIDKHQRHMGLRLEISWASD